MEFVLFHRYKFQGLLNNHREIKKEMKGELGLLIENEAANKVTNGILTAGVAA